MKAIANTTIKLGALINIPVQVVQAVETANDVTFKQAGPNGEPLRQAYLLPDSTECPKESIQKGIFQGTDFRPVSPEDLEKITEATKLPDLEVLEVIDQEALALNAYRSTGLYYVQSNKKVGSVNVFKLFVDALEAEGKCLVSKWTARSRQKLMVIYPKDGVLMANSLCFEGDIREPDETVRAHLAGKYTDKELDMARQLLNSMGDSPADALSMEVDEAVPMKRHLVDQALSGEAVAVPEAAPAPATEGDLEGALAASLAALK